MNYEKDVRIDETSLDIEWLEQSSLMLKYGINESDLEKKKDLLKEKLDLTKADLDRKIRENPESFEISKITETVVANTIIMQDEYKEVYHEFLEVQHEYNIAKVAVRAIAQRKDALENLVRLHGQQYFAGPKVPRDIAKERQNRDETRQANNKKVKRLRKK
jgi:hypothetical protein